MSNSPNPVVVRPPRLQWLDLDLAYRLDVIAASAADAVAASGSWLFDRAKGGWRIRVFVVDFENQVPLDILGVETVMPITELKPDDLSRSATLAVQAEVLVADKILARRIRASKLLQGREIVVWGDASEEVQQTSETVCYARPSSAARAFKACALAAAGVDAAIGPALETFARASQMSGLSYQSDLRPVEAPEV